MENKLRLREDYTRYRFAVADHDIFDPECRASIVLVRLKDLMVIAYTDYERYVSGSVSDGAPYIRKLYAVADFLNYTIYYARRLGTYSLSDITLDAVQTYERYISDKRHTIIVGDFIYNLSLAGKLKNIKPADLII